MSVISGAYSATYDGDSVGNVEVGGFRDRWSYDGKKVSFDAVGTGPVDTIYTGIAIYIDFVCEEYDAAAIPGIIWPWHAIIGQSPAAGLSMWQRAKPFILTSCRDDINPQTVTFYKTILAQGFETGRNYSANTERITPIRLVVYPVKYNAGGYAEPAMPTGCVDMVYFTETYFVP